mgnify:FL=1
MCPSVRYPGTVRVPGFFCWVKRWNNVEKNSELIKTGRYVKKQKNLYAREEIMTLEDVFLYYFGEKAGADHDVL